MKYYITAIQIGDGIRRFVTYFDDRQYYFDYNIDSKNRRFFSDLDFVRFVVKERNRNFNNLNTDYDNIKINICE